MRTPVLILASLGLLSCTSSTDNGPPVATPADVVILTNAATLGGNAYAPNSLTFSLAAKTTVKWRNSDNTDHTVTDDNGVFASGALGQGGTFSFRFDTAGVYTYHCEIHPSMVATITVTP